MIKLMCVGKNFINESRVIITFIMCRIQVDNNYVVTKTFPFMCSCYWQITKALESLNVTLTVTSLSVENHTLKVDNNYCENNLFVSDA